MSFGFQNYCLQTPLSVGYASKGFLGYCKMME